MSAVQAGPSCLRGQITSFTVPPKQISVKNVYPCHVNFIFFLTEHTTGVYIKHCYTLVDAEKTFIIFGEWPLKLCKDVHIVDFGNIFSAMGQRPLDFVRSLKEV